MSAYRQALHSAFFSNISQYHGRSNCENPTSWFEKYIISRLEEIFNKNVSYNMKINIEACDFQNFKKQTKEREK